MIVVLYWIVLYCRVSVNTSVYSRYIVQSVHSVFSLWRGRIGEEEGYCGHVHLSHIPRPVPAGKIRIVKGSNINVRLL